MEFAIVSRSTRRAIDRGDSLEAIWDTMQNVDPRGLVVKMLEWGQHPTRRRTTLLTVSELPAEDVLRAGNPLALLTNHKNGRTNG